jgi:hypothetical protein
MAKKEKPKKSDADLQINYDFGDGRVNISINLKKETLIDDVANKDAVRYLKGIFTNEERFIDRFINPIKKIKEDPEMDEQSKIDFECDDFMDEVLKLYRKATPFSYAEGFKIKNQEFRARVFGAINIGEMIAELGHERIQVKGRPVKHKKFDEAGNFLGFEEYDVIYETHKVYGTKLELGSDVYAVKCWCTSTNKEHWIWIEEKYKDDPLEAIASTFRIHKNLIEHIQELKRQGDILIVEMKEEVTPEGEIVPLTADQYFGLLTAQS